MWKRKNSLFNRTISGTMGILMTAMSAFSPLATLPVYANESLIDLEYNGAKSDEVEIYVQSEGMSFEPGSSVELKVTVQNHTDKTLVDGGLSWRDNEDVLENKQFVLPDAYGADENIASGSNVNSPVEINEKGSVTNITLAPGEKFEVVFTAAVDDSLELFSRGTLGFFFGSHHADDYDEIETNTMEFDFTAGLVTLLPVEFEDEDHEVEAGSTGSMTIALALDTSEYAYNVSHENLAPDSETDGESTATDANAEDVKAASDSNSDEKESLEIASGSTEKEVSAVTDFSGDKDEDADTATDSNGDEDDTETATGSNGAEDENEEDDEEDEYLLELEKIFYNITTYNVEFDDVEVVSANLTEGSDGVIANIEYDVDEKTPLGTYFGKIAAKVELDGRTYYATQGFDVTVVDSRKKLSAEQLAEVQRVLDLIAQLPTREEYFAATDKFFFEDGTMDEEGFDAYIHELAKIAIPAFEAYQALNDGQKALIPAADVEKLEFIYGLCEGVTLELGNNMLSFQIKWTDKNKTLNVFVVDIDGNGLLPNELDDDGDGVVEKPSTVPNMPGTHNIEFARYGEAICRAYELGDYKYKSSYIYDSKQNKISIEKISYNDTNSGWLYRDNESYKAYPGIDTLKAESVDVYIEYEKVESDRSTIINTSVNKDIKINLFNYGSNINDKGRVLEFMNGGLSTEANRTINWFKFLDGHGIYDRSTYSYRPVMSKTLINGYPYVDGQYQDNVNGKTLLSGTEQDNTGTVRKGSLQYLFDKTEDIVTGEDNWISIDYNLNGEQDYQHVKPILKTIDSHPSDTTTYATLRYDTTFVPKNSGAEGVGYRTPYKSMHFDLDSDGGLFQKKNGYYEYDSSQNAAYFNGERFEIYEQLIAPGYETGNSGNNNWKNFLPFNKPGEGYNSDEDATINTYKSHPELGKDVYILGYDANGNTDFRESIIDTWFGMSMEFDFYVPKNGQMDVNGELQDMVFEFSGDDDVWVYVDDVLVLDIGGCHGRQDGTINFKTGDVTYPSEDNYNIPVNTNLYDVFKSAKGEENVDENEFEKTDGSETLTRFRDYTKHTLKFFYLERGGSISFCKLKFNMPILPENSLSVTKQVDDPGDFIKNDDKVTYKFKVVEKGSEKSFIPEGTTYSILDENMNLVEEKQLGDDGIFELLDGQTAQFEKMLEMHDIDGETLYTVEEIGLNRQVYAEPEIVLNTDSSTRIEGYKTPQLSAEESQIVEFTNTVLPGDLKFKKQVLRGDDTTDTSGKFNFEIAIPKALADDYEYIKDGTTSMEALTFVSDPNSDFAVAKIDGVSHEDEYIIKNLPAGIEVKITEVTSDGYDITWTGNAISSGSSVLGNIPCNGELAFICTNKDITGDLIIEKQIEKTTDPTVLANEFEFEIILATSTDASYEYQIVNNPNDDYSNFDSVTKQTVTFTPDGEYSYGKIFLKHGEACKIYGLPIVEVTVTELTTEGYIVTWIDGDNYKNNDITINPNNGASATSTIRTNQPLVFICSNEYLTNVTIDKIVTGNLGDRSQMFEFTAVITDLDEVVTKQIFHLAHDSEPYVIKDVRVGSQVVITEASVDNYEASYKIGSKSTKGNEATITKVPSEGIMITFTNHKEATIDTGILLDSAPYLLTLAIALGGMAIYVINKRKKEDDDLE